VGRSVFPDPPTLGQESFGISANPVRKIAYFRAPNKLHVNIHVQYYTSMDSYIMLVYRTPCIHPTA